MRRGTGRWGWAMAVVAGLLVSSVVVRAQEEGEASAEEAAPAEGAEGGEEAAEGGEGGEKAKEGSCGEGSCGGK